jgi:uncharacterized protein with PIN domain
VDASAFLELYFEEPDSTRAEQLLSSDPDWATARRTLVEARRNLALRPSPGAGRPGTGLGRAGQLIERGAGQSDQRRLLSRPTFAILTIEAARGILQTAGLRKSLGT